MPRARLRQQWKPLTLSHDIAIRDDTDKDDHPHASPEIDPSEFVDGLCVFIETLDSIVHPRPLKDYGVECSSLHASVIFFLKPDDYDPVHPLRQPMQMCNFGDLPGGTAEVLGSALKLPKGSSQGQRVLYIRYGDGLFSVVLWCSAEQNWAHLATYHDEAEKIRVLVQPTAWNSSTTEFLKSHNNERAGLIRLYRLGTGNMAFKDDFVVDCIQTDPFSPAIRAKAAFIARTTDSTATSKPATPASILYCQNTPDAIAASVLPVANALHAQASSPVTKPHTPQRRHVHAETRQEREDTPNANPSSVPHMSRSSHRGCEPPMYADNAVHPMQIPPDHNPYSYRPHQQQWTPSYAQSHRYGPHASHAVQWPQEFDPTATYHTPFSYTYAPTDYYPPYPVPSGHTQLMVARGSATPCLRTVRESPVSPTIAARSTMREAVMKMPEQAKERNKNLQEYRTVLHDPYRQQNKTPLRANAPPFATPQLPTTATPAAKPTPFTPGMPMTLPTSRIPATAIRKLLPIGEEIKKLSTSSFTDSYPDNDWQTRRTETLVIHRPCTMGQYTKQDFNGPFFTDKLFSPMGQGVRPEKSHDEEINDWWWSGNKFSRQEDFYQSIVAVKDVPTTAARVEMPQFAAPHLNSTPKKPAKHRHGPDLGRLMVPMLENLSAYIEGPISKRRDYFSRWKPAPEWCFDRSNKGCESFFDKDWGHPPARIGRDMRYREAPRFGWFNATPVRGRPGDRQMVFGRDT